MPEPNLTERQQKWFATVRAGSERDTGKTMAEWVATARTCPEVAAEIEALPRAAWERAG